jgi:predicted short-subunit dehydrogenase-like oxidoreductase (DUF2520 family)
VDRRVDQLNSLLRGEISAVETHKQAIENIDDEHAAEATLLREAGVNAESLNWGQR